METPTKQMTVRDAVTVTFIDKEDKRSRRAKKGTPEKPIDLDNDGGKGVA